MSKFRVFGLLVLLVSLPAAVRGEARTELVPIVSIHVGDDDRKEGTFDYPAPPGFIIKDIQLHEVTKGGDAQYNVVSKTENEVRVHWRVASKRVRGPFKMVVNTITAFLTLEMTVSLETIAPVRAVEPQIEVKEQPPVIEEKQVGPVTALRILVDKRLLTKFLAYGGTLLGGLWAFWCALPNSRKEAVIDSILQRIRRKQKTTTVQPERPETT